MRPHEPGCVDCERIGQRCQFHWAELETEALVQRERAQRAEAERDALRARVDAAEQCAVERIIERQKAEDERDEAREAHRLNLESLAIVTNRVVETKQAIGAGDGTSLVDAARALVAERDSLRAEVERLCGASDDRDSEVAKVEAEHAVETHRLRTMLEEAVGLLRRLLELGVFEPSYASTLNPRFADQARTLIAKHDATAPADDLTTTKGFR